MRCILGAGSLRNEPHGNRKLVAAEVANKEESYAASLARLKQEFARPILTKSVREKATKKQVASWNAS
jgi:hypothetical protein